MTIWASEKERWDEQEIVPQLDLHFWWLRMRNNDSVHEPTKPILKGMKMLYLFEGCYHGKLFSFLGAGDMSNWALRLLVSEQWAAHSWNDEEKRKDLELAGLSWELRKTILTHKIIWKSRLVIPSFKIRKWAFMALEFLCNLDSTFLSTLNGAFILKGFLMLSSD